FSSRRRHTRSYGDWSSDVCSSDLEPSTLRESVYDTAATLLAAGLDPRRCIFFRQGDVPEHTELTWLLSAVTAYGELNRMTQFKRSEERRVGKECRYGRAVAVRGVK